MNFTPNAFPEDIAERLQKLTHQPEETREEMKEALYDLLAICENQNNDEKYRVLYNTLSVLANGFFEIRATYAERDDKKTLPDVFVKYFRGDTPEAATFERYQYGENHYLAKYTRLNIESVGFVPIE
jgi:hypothetical protein